MERLSSKPIIGNNDLQGSKNRPGGHKYAMVINMRVQKANEICYQISMTIIGKQDLSRKAKILLFKSLVLAVLLYEAESWSFLDRHAKVVYAKMRFLRKILGKTR